MILYKSKDCEMLKNEAEALMQSMQGIAVMTGFAGLNLRRFSVTITFSRAAPRFLQSADCFVSW